MSNANNVLACRWRSSWAGKLNEPCLTPAAPDKPFCEDCEKTAHSGQIHPWQWCPAHPKSGQCRIWLHAERSLCRHFEAHSTGDNDLKFMGGSQAEAARLHLWYDAKNQRVVQEDPATGLFSPWRPAAPKTIVVAPLTFYAPCCGNVVLLTAAATLPGCRTTRFTCECGVHLEGQISTNALGEVRSVISESYYRRHTPDSGGSR